MNLDVVIYFNFNIDFNECLHSNGGCSHYCHNTFSSYYCSCNSDQELDVDNHTCIGIILYTTNLIITDENKTPKIHVLI